MQSDLEFPEGPITFTLGNTFFYLLQTWRNSYLYKCVVFLSVEGTGPVYIHVRH